jgi:hypothetical protein
MNESTSTFTRLKFPTPEAVLRIADDRLFWSCVEGVERTHAQVLRLLASTRQVITTLGRLFHARDFGGLYLLDAVILSEQLNCGVTWHQSSVTDYQKNCFTTRDQTMATIRTAAMSLS